LIANDECDVKPSAYRTSINGHDHKGQQPTAKIILISGGEKLEQILENVVSFHDD
jgi:hypothetical protein